MCFMLALMELGNYYLEFVNSYLELEKTINKLILKMLTRTFQTYKRLELSKQVNKFVSFSKNG